MVGAFVVSRIPQGRSAPRSPDRPSPTSPAGAAMRVYECATCGEQHKMLILAIECCDPAAYGEND